MFFVEHVQGVKRIMTQQMAIITQITITTAIQLEIKKFKVDINSNAEDLVMGNNVAVQYYPNIDFQKVEIPSSVTLATLSNVSVG